MRVKSLARSLLPLLLVSACGGEPVAPLPSRLTGGLPVSGNPLGAVALWRVGGSEPFCSGVLLSNEWVLTAGSCFTESDYVDPTHFTVILPDVFLFTTAVEIFAQSTVALVRLAEPRPINGSTTGYELARYLTYPVGLPVRCQGFGPSGDAVGTLHEGFFSLQEGEAFNSFQVTNGSGGVTLQLPGDLGGPCFVNEGGAFRLVGVLGGCAGSTCSYHKPTDSELSTGYYQRWRELRDDYEIMNAANLKCVEVRGFGAVEQWDCTGDAAQRYRRQAIGNTGNLFRLRDSAAGRCLAASANGTTLTYRACGSNFVDDELFRFYESDSGHHQIQSSLTNRCLDVPGGGTDNGLALQQYPCHSGDNQRFRLRVHTPAATRVVRQGACIGTPDGSTAVGTDLALLPCSGSADQQQQLLPQGELGLLEIRPSHVTGQCFDIETGDTLDGRPLQQFTCLGGLNQRFELYLRLAPAVEIRAKHSDKCLQAVGTAVQQMDCTPSATQSFVVD